jgi:hypothetical protein
MKEQTDILQQFPKSAFWDVDPKQLDLQADSDFIIPRALFMTTQDTFDIDIHKLENVYTHQQIIHALQTTRERISNTVCRLAAAHYHIPSFARFSR